MTIQIRPTRMELNDRFPMLGFTIRTAGDVDKYEVVVASEPGLFAASAKSRRNRGNFYSSSASGPLPVARDEAVYVLPPEVLLRFLGQPKLYFATAGYNGAGPAKAEIGTLPSDASPYINLTGLSGRSLRRVRVLPNRQRQDNGYGSGNNAELEWAGDAAQPGLTPAAGPKPGTTPAAVVAAPADSAKAAALAYNDGFGNLPPVESPPAADHAPDAKTQHHPHHAKPPYGAAVDSRAASLGADIPLDPGNGGMSIGPDALQVGDIILSTTDAASSGLIRFGTGSAVSHAMLYVGQGQQVIEAIGAGIVMRPLTDAIAHATVAVAFRAPGLDDAGHQLIADAAVPHVGEPYDYVGIVRQAAFQMDKHVCDLLSGDAAATCRRFIGSVDLGTQRPGTFFCSALVVAAYAAGGAALTTTQPNWTSPDDLAELSLRSGALAYVGHLKAPPVNASRSIFGLGLSANAVAADDIMAHRAIQQTHAMNQAAALGANASVNWDELQLIPQPTGNSCWATAGAMVLGWADQVSLAPETVAKYYGRTTALGIYPQEHKPFGDAIGLQSEPPQSYSVAGFQQLLEANGPLWVGIALPGSGHAIVVTGMCSDGAADGTGTFIRIADPWDRIVGTPGAPGAYLPTHSTGSRYIMNWADFTREYEARATSASDGTVNIQILHASGTGGRSPNRVSPPTPDWAMAADPALPPPPPPIRAHALDGGAIAITSAVVGAVMTRVINGDANITWELDQMSGLKHPNDVAPTPAAAFRDIPTIRLTGWPYAEAIDGDRISADFTVDAQCNGLSLGNIRIGNVGTNGAVLQKLRVKAQIMNDAILYPAASPRMAALRVRVHYQFTRAIGSDAIAVTDLHLYADGTFDQTSTWLQY